MALSKFLFVFLFIFTLEARSAVTLENSFKAALNRSELVQQDKEKIIQADSKISQLRGAILPQLSLNATYTRQPDLGDVYRQFSPPDQTQAQLTVTQPIFRGFREWETLGQVKHLKLAQEAAQVQTFSRIYQDIAANYFQILSLEQDFSNLKDQSELYEKRVAELSARVQRGESNQTDVVTAKSTHASLTAEMGVIEGQIEVARENYNFLTGLPTETELVDPQLDSTKVLTLEKYTERVEERPEIRGAKERLEAADNNLSSQWGGHWPSLDATGNYYLTRPGFLSNINWDIGLRLTFPIFEGGATQAKITEAASQKKEAALELERLRRTAHQEIKSIYRRLNSRLNQIKSLKLSTELSKKNTELVERDYKRGLAKSIDVQLALTEHRMSLRSYDQAYFSTQLDLIQLQAAAAMIPPLLREAQQ